MSEQNVPGMDVGVKPVVRCCGNCKHASEFILVAGRRGPPILEANCMHDSGRWWTALGMRPFVCRGYGTKCHLFEPNA